MSSATQRSFHCSSCHGVIYIPLQLPPTTAPCPHCGSVITSPAIEPVPLHQSRQPAAPIAAEAQTQQSATQHNTEAATAVAQAKQSRISSADAAADPEPEKNSILGWILAAVLLAILCGGSWFTYKIFVRPAAIENPPKDQVDAATSPLDATADLDYQTEGWKKDASAILGKFLSAKTREDKASCVIGGMETLQRLEKQYGSDIYREAETQLDSFLPIQLNKTDSERNIFLMAYDRPAQFELSKYFLPLATYEMQSGIEKTDPLTESIIQASNFTMDAMKIEVFFKHTPTGMLLDWDIYLQTRYRTLQKFYDHSKAGDSAVFRVLIVEEVPLPEQSKADVRIYRVGDPAYTGDTFRVSVPASSDVAKALSKIHWRNTENILPKVSTVTIELTRSSPDLITISRFICWEFEGLGGGNSIKNEANALDHSKTESKETDSPLEELPAPSLGE